MLLVVNGDWVLIVRLIILRLVGMMGKKIDLVCLEGICIYNYRLKIVYYILYGKMVVRISY